MDNNKGFSLVELIIVIAITALLVSILTPQFLKYSEQSRESKDLENIEAIKKAVEAYSAEHEQRGVHVVEATGTVIKYVLGDGGSLEHYGIETAVTQSSSNRMILKWEYSDFKWELIFDNSTGYYDAYGRKK